MTEVLQLHVGDDVTFHGEDGRWDVRAVTTGGRFAILTQPAEEGVHYTIVDRERYVRGQDNYHGLGYESDDDIAEVLHALQHTEDDTHSNDFCTLPNGTRIGDLCIGQADVSFRDGNHVRLDIFIVNHHHDADHT